jgi:hypothetical protein
MVLQGTRRRRDGLPGPLSGPRDCGIIDGQAARTEDPDVTPKTRFWSGVLVLFSAVNLVAVWFAARPGEATHATTHAVLALACGLWAQRLRLRAAARPSPAALDPPEEFEALDAEVGDMRQELSAMQERLDFAERMLTQRADPQRVDPPPPRPGS